MGEGEAKAQAAYANVFPKRLRTAKRPAVGAEIECGTGIRGTNLGVEIMISPEQRSQPFLVIMALRCTDHSSR